MASLGCFTFGLSGARYTGKKLQTALSLPSLESLGCIQLLASIALKAHSVHSWAKCSVLGDVGTGRKPCLLLGEACDIIEKLQLALPWTPLVYQRNS